MYVIVWEFEPRPGKEAEFERAYGPQGDWARFFARGAGYLGTELLKDASGRPRYLTIDRWMREEDFEAFEAPHRDEYARIDARCEALTLREMLVGRFLANDG